MYVRERDEDLDMEILSVCAGEREIEREREGRRERYFGRASV